MASIQNVIRHWDNKASVRTWRPYFLDADSALDYPMSSLPSFEVHDTVAYESNLHSIATGLWLNYNVRTIQAEEFIALPAIDLLTNSSLIRNEVKEGLLQTAVDEKFHTYIHNLAINNATVRYKQSFHAAPSITVAALHHALEAEHEKWKRDLLVIAYAAVAEVSINAFLEILSQSSEIKESNRALVDRHNRDEAVHTLIFIEATKDLLVNADAVPAAYLRSAIVDARDSFLKHDFSMYEAIFRAHDIEPDFSRDSDSMSRDMSGVNRLIRIVRE